jgi:lysozyme
MKLSQKGEKTLIQEEGFKSEPYLCSAGKPTIGIGHRIKAGERFTTLTFDQAIQLMRQDIAPIEAFINNYMPKLTQNQFDALVMFIFNIGETRFLNSSVFSYIKDRNFEEATKPWAKWINVTEEVKDPVTGEKVKDPVTGEINKKLVPVEGLIKRRAVEINLFNS